VREQALSEPVGIKRHGKVNVIVLSVKEYERLKRSTSVARWRPWGSPRPMQSASIRRKWIAGTQVSIA
jgi:hypothetical protein